MGIERIGIVGAGTMGNGIAVLSCLARYPTLIHDPDEKCLERVQTAIRLTFSAGKGRRWSEAEAEAACERLGPAAELGALAGCDLIVEAAPEDLALKQGLFAELAETCGPEAILATNTSSLRVTEIAAEVAQPQRVVGMHFFNPPAAMRLVEVVAATESAERALEATTEVVVRMGRVPIRTKDSPGFVANRLARPFSLEALRMLADGVADAATIDRVCRLGAGFPMGPFELLDLIGLDVNLSTTRSLYEQAGKPARWRPSPLQERLVAEGRLGRKSGHGFYRYGQGRHREQDPDLDLRPPTLNRAELKRIDPAGHRILALLIAQIANEAAFAVEEDIAAPADINTAMRLGFNWPLGPLEFSGMLGAGPAVLHLEEQREISGEAYRPARRLIKAAEEG